MTQIFLFHLNFILAEVTVVTLTLVVALDPILSLFAEPVSNESYQKYL